MTNEYVLMSELQQPLYSSQEKDLFKKKITKKDLPPHRHLIEKREFNGAVEHPALRILRKCENQMCALVAH
jgi:hypothetical protein